MTRTSWPTDGPIGSEAAPSRVTPAATKPGTMRGLRRARARSLPLEPQPVPHDVVLYVTLRDVEPPIWRRLRVPDRLTLHQLHRVLQLAFGWLDYHLYEFTPVSRASAASKSGRVARGQRRSPEVRYAEPDPDWDDPDGEVQTRDSRQVTLRDLALKRGARLIYVYDFGDDWTHDVRVERVVASRVEDEGEALPMVLDGARAGPPEDAGGVLGDTVS